MPGPNSLQDIRWYPQWTLDKGLFSNVHQVDIPLDGFSIVDNFICRDGILRCRPGTVPTLTPMPGTGEAVAHIGFFPRRPPAGAPTEVMMTISGAGPPYDYKLYVGFPWGGPVVLGVNAVPAPRQIASTVFKDRYYIAPGDDVLLVVDGVGAHALTIDQPIVNLKVPHAPYYVTSNDSRVFLANTFDGPLGVGTQRVPYRIHWSDFLDARTWNGGIDGGSSRYADLAGEPDPITGIWASGDVVVAFKRRAIYTGQFVGAPRYYDFTRTSRGVGCISHQTIKEWKNGILIWLGDDNVYMGVPGQKPQPLLTNTSERFRFLTQLNRANLRMSRAVVDRTKDFYHLFFPGETPDLWDKIFSINLNTGAVWEGTFPTGTSVFSATDTFVEDYDQTTTEPNDFWNSVLWVGTEDHRILRFDWDVTDDDGTPISCRARTGIWNYSKLANRETMELQPQACRILGEETGTSVSISVAGLDGYTRAGSGSFGGVQVLDGTSSFYVEGRCQGESAQIDFTADSLARFTGLALAYIPKGDIHRRK